MADIRILIFSLDPEIRKSLSLALPSEQYSLDFVTKLDDFIPHAMENPPHFCIFDEKGVQGEWVEISQSMDEIMDLSHIDRLLIARKDITPGLVSLAVQAGISEIIPRDIDTHMLLLKMDALSLRHARCRRNIQLQQDIAARRVGYSVEHYTGQPLTAVMGAAQMLKLLKNEGKNINDPDVEEILAILLNASEELSRTIHKFANLKSFQIQKYIVNHDLIDLEHLSDKDEPEKNSFEMF